MVDWPLPLIDDLARRRAVVFIGAGVSSASHGLQGTQPPLWEEFLLRALERCDGQKQHIRQALRENDLLTACELVRNRLDENWVDVLRENFVVPKYQPNQLHSDIYRLDVRFVLTPNVDKIYDGLSARESENTVSGKNYYDRDIAGAFRDNARIGLKIHGTIDQPGRMICTRREYANTRIQHAGFYSAVEALIVTHTFVFVGCSLKDPDLQLIRENHAFTYPQNKPHYMLMPKVHDEIMDLMRQNMNLKAMVYSARDEHKELLDSVAELVARVDERRQVIARENDW